MSIVSTFDLGDIFTNYTFIFLRRWGLAMGTVVLLETLQLPWVNYRDPAWDKITFISGS